MIEILYQAFQTAIMAADTGAALSLLQEHKSELLLPIEGCVLHAKLLYCTLKHPDPKILDFLLKLPVFSDISFFQYCGHTPLSLALEEGHPELASLLATKIDKKFALQMATNLKMKKTTQFLLNHFTYTERFLKMLGLHASKTC